MNHCEAQESVRDTLQASVQVHSSASKITIVPVVTWSEAFTPDTASYRYRLFVHQQHHSNTTINTQAGQVPLGRPGEAVPLSQVTYRLNLEASYAIELHIFKNEQPILQIRDKLDPVKSS